MYISVDDTLMGCMHAKKYSAVLLLSVFLFLHIYSHSNILINYFLFLLFLYWVTSLLVLHMYVLCRAVNRSKSIYLCYNKRIKWSFWECARALWVKDARTPLEPWLTYGNRVMMDKALPTFVNEIHGWFLSFTLIPGVLPDADCNLFKWMLSPCVSSWIWNKILLEMSCVMPFYLSSYMILELFPKKVKTKEPISD